jgi:exonuclease III
LKHIQSCGIGVKNSKSNKKLQCSNCNKAFTSAVWFERHRSKCTQAAKLESEHNLEEQPFNFSDTFFDDPFSFDQAGHEDEVCSSFLPEKSWLTDVAASKEDGKFSIFHLNLNSVFNKFEHVYSLLNAQTCDIIMLNEVKLDENIPSKLFQHNSYTLLRRDRNKSGGGILVYIRNCYKVLETIISPDYELIFFKLLINKKVYSFVATYKPPSTDNKDYLNYLETFIHSNNLNSSWFIIGDLNLDLLSTKGDLLKSFMSDNDLKNFVESPTRVAFTKNYSSSTLIDVILHNKNNILNTSVIDFPYSDHKIVFCNCNFESLKSETPNRMSRKINAKTLQKIVDDIAAIDFSTLNCFSDLNERWFFFKQIFNKVIDDNAPLKKSKPRHERNLPWYDNDLRKAERKCSKLFVKSKKYPSSVDIKENFLEARRNYQSLLRSKKTEFFKNKTPKDFKSAKDFWEFQASSVKVKSDKSSNTAITSITVDGKKLNDSEDIANEFNKFFSSFASDSSVSSEDCEAFIFKNFKTLFKDKPTTSFSFCPTTSDKVLDLLSKLDNKASAGKSGIPTRLIKACKVSITPFLVDLFNDCIDSGTFIDEWKCAVVTPLHKKGDFGDLNNYRGISILPVISKVFEKVLADQIKNYFVSNNLLSDHQHGFRESHSCETALHEIISSCLKNLDKKWISVLLFVDFKKAFDMLCRRLLLYKCGNYGFDSKAIRLLTSYFSNRVQFVKIANAISREAVLGLGVPQGSVLGPLLFIIFINDLPEFLLVLTKLFADDTTCLFFGPNVDDVMTKLKAGIALLQEWCKFNRLYVNWAKTFIMFVTNKRVQIPKSVQIDGHEIMVVDKFKLLGVCLDNKLLFEDFVAQQCKAISGRLFSIKRLFFLPFEVKLTFFKAFILPSFDYCASLCIYLSKKLIQKLNKFYYICLFKLFKYNFYGLSCAQITERLSPFGLSSFTHRICTKILTFYAKIGSYATAPQGLKDMINLTRLDNQNYNLRSNNMLVVVNERLNNRFGEKMFSTFGAKLINSFKFLNFFNNFVTFKKDIFYNLNVIVDNFVNLFPNFNLDSNFYFFLHKS